MRGDATDVLPWEVVTMHFEDKTRLPKDMRGTAPFPYQTSRKTDSKLLVVSPKWQDNSKFYSFLFISTFWHFYNEHVLFIKQNSPLGKSENIYL